MENGEPASDDRTKNAYWEYPAGVLASFYFARDVIAYGHAKAVGIFFDNVNQSGRKRKIERYSTGILGNFAKGFLVLVGGQMVLCPLSGVIVAD